MSSRADCCFLDLACVLPFDDDFLTVPQQGDLSTSSSLDVTDLFLPELSFEGSAEATSSFSSPASEASSRLEELPSFDLQLPLGDLHQRQEAPAPAPLPLGPSGLRLKLDCSSVMAAWRGTHPFQMQGAQLAAAAAAIPSTADLQASLATAAQQPGGFAPPALAAAYRGAAAPAASAAGAIYAAAAAEAEARHAKEASAAAAREAQRVRDAARRAAQRKSGERKVAYPARKVSADKRPRIKGRFVTKAEFEQVVAAVDRAVPVPVCAAA